MSTTPPPNPFEAFKAAYDQAAENWSKSMEQVLSSEDFAAAAGRMVARYADAQEALRLAAKASSEQLHLPTKDDLAQVSGLVLNLERKIDDATDQLFALARSATALPSADVFTQFSDRLGALEAAFQGLVSTLTQIAGSPAPSAPAVVASPPTPSTAKPAAAASTAKPAAAASTAKPAAAASTAKPAAAASTAKRTPSPAAPAGARTRRRAAPKE